jgi:hypothetical protein
MCQKPLPAILASEIPEQAFRIAIYRQSDIRMEAPMATLTQSYKPATARIVFARKFDNLLEGLMPRRSMVVSVGMIFAGLGIPALMVFKVLPLSMFLGFLGLALIAAGGILALVWYGEI